MAVIDPRGSPGKLYWISTEFVTRQSSLQAKNEIIQVNCIITVSNSVYHEIFVSHLETVRLNLEEGGKRSLRDS